MELKEQRDGMPLDGMPPMVVPGPPQQEQSTTAKELQIVAATAAAPGRLSNEVLATELKKCLRHELYVHSVPLSVVFVLLLCPKLLIVWLPLALIWSGIEAAYPRMPVSWRLRAQRAIPDKVRTSRIVQELREGIGQVRPFILISLYLFCIPFSLLWMLGYWIKGLLPSKHGEKGQSTALSTAETMTFVQNRRKYEEEAESNFFHSPAFGITCIAVFGCGLPAAITYLFYQMLGVDAILGFPSHDPQFQKIFVVIGLYIYSLSWCLSILFIRTWFTFPLNFSGDESRVEITQQRIRRYLHGWFSQVLTWNMPWSGRDSLLWEEVKFVGYSAPHEIKMYPLPETVFSADSIFYKAMNKGAQFIDGVAERMPTNESIYFCTVQEAGRTGSQIKVNLSDLDGDERARLFYAVKNWAPHAVLDQRVQDRMLGSSVMQAPRYTQMWFELLTDKMPRKRAGALKPNDQLRDGQLTVKERLSSGGQASVYVAQQADGAEIVLKEFILSSADSVGALVESAGEFETESTLLSELKHERIVRMIDFFAEDRRLYLVLERAQGQSLREFIKKNGSFYEEQTIRIALQISEVLEYLHEQSPPVVHRDIAPDNVIFDAEHNEIKVIDFSLAAGKKTRKTTSTMGKHSYAPPEQLRELPCPQSDIYALGATMSFLLVGSDPKPITTVDIKSKRADVSDELARILRQATELEVERRYSHIKWMKLELEALLQTLTGSPSVAAASPSSEQENSRSDERAVTLVCSATGTETNEAE